MKITRTLIDKDINEELQHYEEVFHDVLSMTEYIFDKIEYNRMTNSFSCTCIFDEHVPKSSPFMNEYGDAISEYGAWLGLEMEIQLNSKGDVSIWANYIDEDGDTSDTFHIEPKDFFANPDEIKWAEHCLHMLDQLTDEQLVKDFSQKGWVLDV